MRVTILGTGTSQGVPVIGCDCEVCLSDDPRDDRLRTSVLIEIDGTNILIDTSPDLRQQMLRYQVSHIDAILYTHEHNDHVIGFDDIRPFNFKQKMDLPFYGMPRVLDDIKDRFKYVFGDSPYPGAPRATLHYLRDAMPFDVMGVGLIPIEVMHGGLPIFGYRVGDFTFITDASYINEDNIEKIKGTKVLIINALRKEKHPSHFKLSEALDVIAKVAPDQAYITHVGHTMGLTKSWEKEIPENVFPAFDGLVIEM